MLKRFETARWEPTNQKVVKVSIIFEPTSKLTCLNFGNQCKLQSIPFPGTRKIIQQPTDRKKYYEDLIY